jgi:hypothetical protein
MNSQRREQHCENHRQRDHDVLQLAGPFALRERQLIRFVLAQEQRVLFVLCIGVELDLASRPIC